MSRFDSLQTFGVTADPGDLGLPTLFLSGDAVQDALNLTFTVVGAMAVLFIIIGGIRYIISAGDSTQIQKAKNTILYAVIGLGLALFSLVIVNFVAGRIQ